MLTVLMLGNPPSCARVQPVCKFHNKTSFALAAEASKALDKQKLFLIH